MPLPVRSFSTFLLFVGEQHGRAEEAMELYVSLFADSEVISVERHGAGGPEQEGTILQARFSLGGAQLIAMDSALGHDFTFTPATSLFVETEDEAELEGAFATLAEGGAVLMPLGEYPFSPKFGWVADRFGVSWQLFLRRD